MQQNDLPEYLQGLPSTPTNTGTPVDLADINLKAAWSKSQGEGAIVAVLDTGIDTTHRDLAHRIWSNTAETDGNGIDDDGNGYIDDTTGWNFPGNNSKIHQPGREHDEWHGSHLAGIIAGVAPQAMIMPLKVFQNGTAYTSDLIEAIAYAERNGAQIANCSWGTTFANPALEEAIAQSALLFVSAAGNNHTDIGVSPLYPASYGSDNIITVASLNQSNQLSGYSNYGATTADVAAPGENIISTIPGDRVGKSSGTSQSAAFVSGEAALILGAHPSANARGFKQAIIQTSDQLPELATQITNGNKINCGKGVSYTVPQSNRTISNNDPSLSVSESVYAFYNELSVFKSVYDTNTTAFCDETNPDNGGYGLYAGEIWTTKTSMPTARHALTAVEVNTNIYAIGGSSSSGTSNKVEAYNPATDTWTTKANMPTARYGLAAAVVNEKIYAIGGGGSGGNLNTVEEYDPTTNTWTSKASMPTARQGLAAAVVNGEIYAIGGHGSSGYLNTVEAYNPTTNTWTSKASMPIGIRYLAASAVNGKIYAIGGSSSVNWFLNTVEEYNPATNTWTAKANMPTARTSLATAVVNGKIYALGGFAGGGAPSKAEEYDPATNTWTTKASMLTGRWYLAAAATGTKIYTFGGSIVGAVILNTVEELSLPSVDSYQYQYDANNCLDYIITPPGQTIDYQYDANGNLLRRILTQ